MKLEKQVVSLELSKKLKELGVKQESLWWWTFKTNEWQLKSRDWIYHFNFEYGVTSEDLLKRGSIYSAFTVAELGIKIISLCKEANRIDGLPFYDKFIQKWVWGDFLEDTEANARAKMLIYLLEHNLIQK